MCLVARSEANDYVLNETAIQHADQEKTFGSHCGKNMETISLVQNSSNGESERGCVVPEQCSSWAPYFWVLVVATFALTTKSEGPVQLGKMSPYPKGESVLQSI